MPQTLVEYGSFKPFIFFPHFVSKSLSFDRGTISRSLNFKGDDGEQEEKEEAASFDGLSGGD